jgi:hypothetical protein
MGDHRVSNCSAGTVSCTTSVAPSLRHHVPRGLDRHSRIRSGARR